jgi:hypothetical protein
VNNSIQATIHQYYDTSNDDYVLDQDYYRIDTYGDSTITVSLSNISVNRNYNVELLYHRNIINSSYSSIENVDSGIHGYNLSEFFVSYNRQPGTYYIRVYSVLGYDEYVPYTLSFSVEYTFTTESISQLRFEKGAKAVIWKSDFDPFGYQPFFFQDEISNKMINVGIKYISNSNSEILNLYSNPFHLALNEKVIGDEILHSILYIWGRTQRDDLSIILQSIADNVETQINNNNTFKFNVETGISVLGLVTTVVSFFNPIGILMYTNTFVGVGSTLSPFILPLLFPNVWGTNKPELLNHLNNIITALETGQNTSNSEVIAIKLKYKYVHTSTPVYDRVEHKYYLDFNVFSTYDNFIYNSDYINSYNGVSHTYGKVYPIRNASDLQAYYNQTPITNIPDINTGGEQIMTLDTEYLRKIAVGEYHWFKFTPAYSGYYDIYSTGTMNTYGEVFSQIDLGRNTPHLLYSDDNSGDNSNFKITAQLTHNVPVWIRVRGSAWMTTGECYVKITPHTHTYSSFTGTLTNHHSVCTGCGYQLNCTLTPTLNQYNTSQHRYTCLCGYILYQSHSFVLDTCSICSYARPHVHSYNHHYVYYNTSSHKAYCSCGNFTTQSHGNRFAETGGGTEACVCGFSGGGGFGFRVLGIDNDNDDLLFYLEFDILIPFEKEFS